MSIQPVGGATAAVPVTGALGPTSAGGPSPVGSPSFDEVLDRFTAERTGQVPEATAAIEATPAADRPSAVGEIVRGADRSYTRLVDLTDRLSADTDLSVQELFQVQLEAHRLTMGLETTTKAVSESGSNLKQTLQQQI